MNKKKRMLTPTGPMRHVRVHMWMGDGLPCNAVSAWTRKILRDVMPGCKSVILRFLELQATVVLPYMKDYLYVPHIYSILCKR